MFITVLILSGNIYCDFTKRKQFNNCPFHNYNKIENALIDHCSILKTYKHISSGLAFGYLIQLCKILFLNQNLKQFYNVAFCLLFHFYKYPVEYILSHHFRLSQGLDIPVIEALLHDCMIDSHDLESCDKLISCIEENHDIPPKWKNTLQELKRLKFNIEQVNDKENITVISKHMMKMMCMSREFWQQYGFNDVVCLMALLEHAYNANFVTTVPRRY